MPTTSLMKTPSLTAYESDWASAIDLVVRAAEAAERGLAINPDGANLRERISTGSFYTPADVVRHFWREYLTFNGLTGEAEIRRHLTEVTFVEPAAGAGIFLFDLLRVAIEAGCDECELGRIRFVAVDINRAALDFIERQLLALGERLGVRFSNVRFVHGDFLNYAPPEDKHVVFVGNPPYVRNPRGSRWRNLYADFLERMIDLPARQRAISLIVPVSIAFSRDYSSLRDRIRQTSRACRLESFDNIPDCLFKAGKPGSQNTNTANSQRCSILSIRDHGDTRWEASPLQRWSRAEREQLLARPSVYRNVQGYVFDNQFPRPSCGWIVDYLRGDLTAVRLGDYLAPGEFGFSVGNVARNYIGLRDLNPGDPSSTALTFASQQHMALALQIVGSPVFYEYWRTIGDGFHVTRSDIERFPVALPLLNSCIGHHASAVRLWNSRSSFERTKLNSGRIVRSYDFRGCFDYLLDCLDGISVPSGFEELCSSADFPSGSPARHRLASKRGIQSSELRGTNSSSSCGGEEFMSPRAWAS